MAVLRKQHGPAGIIAGIAGIGSQYSSTGRNRRTPVKLTDTKVRKAKPAAKMYRMSDGHGLYMQVQPNGTKCWHYGYRFEGKQRLLSLGTYPVVTLAAAREAHIDARRRLATGINPAAEKRVQKREAQGTTFADVTTLWFDLWKGDKAVRYVNQMQARIDNDILPAIGSRPIREIEVPELVEVAKAIEARGASELAKRSLETMGQIFRYAIAHGMASRNPATDVKPSDVLRPVKAKNHPRVGAKELPALSQAIAEYNGALTSLAMRLMAYTFVRTSELVGARWEEFNLDGDNPRWDIPAKRMKMDSPHIVPLSRQSVAVLRFLHQVTGKGEYVFPGTGKARHMSTGTILLALDRMGYRGVMTGHGFRSVASTLLHEAGWDEKYIEAQLAHQKRDKTAAAYNHAAYLLQRTEMVRAWADIWDDLSKQKQIAAA
jgi:integrase